MIISEGRLCLRWVSETDTDQLVDLLRACLGREGWTRADLTKFMNSPARRNVIKVLTDDRAVVYGTLMYSLTPWLARVRRVAVWPDYRRRGLGAFMVNALVSARSPLKQPVVTAKVKAGDEPARLFFEGGMGFVPAGDETPEYRLYKFDRAAG